MSEDLLLVIRQYFNKILIECSPENTQFYLEIDQLESSIQHRESQLTLTEEEKKIPLTHLDEDCVQLKSF